MKRFLLGSLLAVLSTQVQAIDLSFCDATLNGADQKSVKGTDGKTYDITFKGKLCAVKPSKTDTQAAPIRDKGPTMFGFGYHAIGVPDNLNANTPIWFHFTGTDGRPYNQSNKEFQTSLFLGEIINKGYLVFQLAYNNDLSINGEVCNPDPADPTKDWCSANARDEVLMGIDLHPDINVPAQEGWDNRLESLLVYLDKKGFPLPSDIQPGVLDYKKWSNFDQFSYSGHSQGGGHAHYIGKYVKSKAICMLAGGYDQADMQNVKNKYADWINHNYAYQTDLDNFGAIVVKGDDAEEALVSMFQDIMGMSQGVDYVLSGNKNYTDKKGNIIANPQTGVSPYAHGAVIGAVELRSHRNNACFKFTAN